MKELKNTKIFFMVLLVLTLVLFTASCSTNATPDVPNTTDEDSNRNGIVDYNNENGTVDDDNGTGGTGDDSMTTDGGINNSTNQ